MLEKIIGVMEATFLLKQKEKCQRLKKEFLTELKTQVAEWFCNMTCKAIL